MRGISIEFDHIRGMFQLIKNLMLDGLRNLGIKFNAILFNDKANLFCTTFKLLVGVDSDES